MPDPTNAVQFRLYTNASPDAPHLFNTFDLQAYGEVLLRSPGREKLGRAPGTFTPSAAPHNILINGSGPSLASTNGMTLIEQASGPDWRYIALDASPAYRGRLERFRRAILFVAPDLFVLYDHLVAKEPVSFQMLVHPPAATLLDTNWGDLHLDLPKAGLTLHSPGRKHDLRQWERLESCALLPGTATMRLAPTNKVAQLHVLTVFAVRHGGEKKDYRFKLLESSSAIGAQIQREGLPTLVAFKTDRLTDSASLTGFPFQGPVGVYVFRPKVKAAKAN